jgi:hypothetical protein
MPRSAGFTFGPSTPRPSWARSEDWTLSRFRISPYFRGLDRFLADEFDLQGFLVVGPNMLAGTNELA